MSEMGMTGNSLNVPVLDEMGIAYTTSQPDSGYWEQYTINGTPVYLTSTVGGGNRMTNGLSEAQQLAVTYLANPYLNQENKDAAVRAAMGGGSGAGGAVGGGSTTTVDPAAQARADADDRARRDAYARLQTVLNDYGLGSLGAAVQTWLVEGLSESEIVQRMRDTPEFKTRFPAIEERKKKGLAPISPGEYVAYERQARQMMRAAGIPEGFYDTQDDFKMFLANDLSLSELGDRVTLAANAAFKMPKEDRDALTRWGMSPGDITAFWLDPDKAQPLLERKYAAAQLAGTGTRSGWGNLDETRASDLASQGVTAAQAEQGFGQLVNSKELFQSLDRTEDVIGEDEQFGAVFGGNANAQRRIEQRARKRRGVFEGGGSFAASQSGLTGLGDTSM